ncbi:MerR family transcriptional regulator [Bacillus sp. V33-4]|uniref:MerR family transcriptional regulator n=1 Tax=Bacillus sp. V33-4 TaxID=2054169 RepID=UPI000C783640|nr:MerR family transcriptional regulator [Bacillus sp. V33-4]PLR81750.1 chromosome segregation protein [Bacillus sp. V33-4]
MNTTAVAKLLGVSSSTIQRWVKQLDLHMQRNDLGHYSFTEDDIKLLAGIKEQVQNGVLLQEVTVTVQRPRKGTVKGQLENKDTEKLLSKVSYLESRLEEKADNVVSYQLLQHRSEIEELQNEVMSLTDRIEALEASQIHTDQHHAPEKKLVFEQSTLLKRPKKRKLISSLFGF